MTLRYNETCAVDLQRWVIASGTAWEAGVNVREYASLGLQPCPKVHLFDRRSTLCCGRHP